MIPIQLNYVVPESLNDAVSLLSNNPNAQVLAGGHSLLIALKLGQTSPSMLVDLIKIQSLQKLTFSQKTDMGLQVGAMATYAQIAGSSEVRSVYPALAEAANSIGDPQIRNYGRAGDSFAYRDLACDLLAAALVLGATFNILSQRGSRLVSADKWVDSQSKLNLEPDELVTAIDFPHQAGAGSAYQAFKHPASNHTLCGVAARVERDANGLVSQCRVAATGVAISTMRLHRVEVALEGRNPIAESIATAAKQATDITPVSEKRSEELIGTSESAEYYRHLVQVMTERALSHAAERSLYQGLA
jgi:aerobic carbon-monoxide dehydrogenase medium subunit